MKAVVYTNQDGGVSVLSPAGNVYVPEDKKSFERADFIAPIGDMPKGYRPATLEEIAARDVPDGLEWHIVELSDLPQDRYFRNAWSHDKGEVSIDMDKAKEIQKDKLRQERAPILADLDVQYMRADEAGDSAKKSDIAQKKQALRDITKHPEIDAAKTPEELKTAALSAMKE